MKVKINITKEVLEESKMCNTGGLTNAVGMSCAIAKAVNNLLGNHAWVGKETINIHKSITTYMKDTHLAIDFGKEIADIPLPEEAKCFIKSFDKLTPEERVKMDEISFEIDIPDSVIEFIGISEAKEIIKNDKYLELVD